MKASNRLARWQVLALLMVLALVLVGCGPTRHGVSWPALDLVTIDEQPLVVVTYNGQIDLIDPYTSGQRYSLGQNADGSPNYWHIKGSDYNNNQFYASPFVSEENGQETLIFPTYSTDNHRFLEFFTATALPVSTGGIPLTGEVVADVVQGDGLLYLGYRQQDLVALDADYHEVWRLDTTAGIWASPVLSEGILYVPSVDHYLYAVNATSGEILWKTELEGAVTASPLLYDGFLYVGSFSHKLFKISLDGEIVASFEGHNWIWSTPVVNADVIYYSDLSGYVYALNPADLSTIWEVRPATRGIRPSPMIYGDFVVVASRDGQVYWLNQTTGATVQTAEFKDRAEILSDILYLPADEANNHPALMLVASTDTGKLVTAFNLDTFTPQWVYNR